MEGIKVALKPSEGPWKRRQRRIENGSGVCSSAAGQLLETFTKIWEVKRGR